jgi:hypothetical protein
MKQIYLLVLLALITSKCFSQITYEKGYIVNEKGVQSDVLIKFDETQSNPSQIEYKFSPEGGKLTADQNSMKEFGVGENYRFVRSKVEIDRSTEDFKNLSRDRNPTFREETLFLRLLIDGEYSLLSYKDGSLQRFFIRKPNGEIDQLIFKKYSSGNNIIRNNSEYRQQLHNLLQCEDITINYLMKVDYRRKELMRLFKDYHTCKGIDYDVFFSKPKGELSFKAKSGINLINLGMEQDIYNNMESDFGYSISPRLGFEMEYTIPMLNNKFTLFTEPSVSLYNVEEQLIVINESNTGTRPVTGVYRANVNLNYINFEIPLGIRFYMFLNEANTSRLFLGGGVSMNLIINTSEVPEDRNGEKSDYEFDQSTLPVYFGGIGYSYNKKYSIEVRYYPERQLTSNFAFNLHHNNSFAIIAGYTLF